MDPMPPVTDIRVQRAIRRLIRAVDLHFRMQQQAQAVTAPHSACLLALVCQASLTLKALSQANGLSPTVGVVDRPAAWGAVDRLAARSLAP